MCFSETGDSSELSDTALRNSTEQVLAGFVQCYLFLNKPCSSDVFPDCAAGRVRVHCSGFQPHCSSVWEVSESGAAALDVRGPGHFLQVQTYLVLSFVRSL